MQTFEPSLLPNPPILSQFMLHCLCHTQGTICHLPIMFLKPKHVSRKTNIVLLKWDTINKLKLRNKSIVTNDIQRQSNYFSQGTSQAMYIQNYANQSQMQNASASLPILQPQRLEQKEDSTKEREHLGANDQHTKTEMKNQEFWIQTHTDSLRNIQNFKEVAKND